MKRMDIDMTKEEIGKILKQLRIDAGMTQKEVAEALGKSQPLIGHWETGYSQPDANTLFTLCSLYGTTVDKAFGFDSEMCIRDRDQTVNVQCSAQIFHPVLQEHILLL